MYDSAMAMRYSKAHTLPFPTYFTSTSEWDVQDLGGGRMYVDLGYKHGPPGRDPPTAMTTQIEYCAATNTSVTTVATAASGPTDYGYLFADIPKVDTRFRVRRLNSIGEGAWSEPAYLDAP